MPSVINTALVGMQASQRAVMAESRAANRVGLGPRGEEAVRNLPGHLIGVRNAQRSFEANLSVLRAADKMLGTLLDIHA